MKKRIAFAACTTVFASVAVHAADLNIEVQGVTEARGAVIIAVYDKADAWLRTPMKSARVDAVPGTVVATLDGLPEGAYAVSLFHDENGNGRLDSNAMRIPIEPWGFSNDAVGMFGPASFEDARFTLPREGARIVIRLKS